MTWSTGNWTSYPSDGRVFIERDDLGWWVYLTVDGGPDDGRIALISENPLVFAPPPHTEPFKTVEEAQNWVMENVKPRSTRL